MVISVVAKLVQYLQNNFWYALLIVLLAVISILLLGYELLKPDMPKDRLLLLQQIDLVIAWIFLSDFFLGLIFNSREKGVRVYWRENWLNLASSIPITSEVTRFLRILRIVRALRIIRSARVVRSLMNFWFAKQRLKSRSKIRRRR